MAEAFQIFEWMVAGYGSACTVPVTQETFEVLLDGCHQSGALEKALEVLTWMRGVGLRPTATAYTQLQDTLAVAGMWDRKVFAAKRPPRALRHKGASPRTLALDALPASALHAAVLPSDLRPAPYDGKRAIYMRDVPGRLQVHACAATPVPGPLRKSIRTALQISAAKQRAVAATALRCMFACRMQCWRCSSWATPRGCRAPWTCRCRIVTP